MSVHINTPYQLMPVDCAVSQYSYSDNECGESGGDASSNPPESPVRPVGMPPIPPSYQLASRAKVHLEDPVQNSEPLHARRQEPDPWQLPFPQCCFHQALVDKLEFIQPPTVESSGVANLVGPYHRLFIGQLRFETTAAEVRWLLQYLTGVTAVKVELRGMGCCMAYFRTYDEIERVCELRYRILFDHTGIWFARDAEQSELLQRYVGYHVSQIGRGFRLPKDMMVVQEEKFQPFKMPQKRKDQLLMPRQHYQPGYSADCFGM